MKLLDNIVCKVGDDIASQLRPGSRVSMATTCFSYYAYEALKSQLESIESFRFIFTTPSFVKDVPEQQRRQFYIPSNLEKSIYGTEFEIRLKNELSQRAIAKECAAWIKSKGCFKSNVSGSMMTNCMAIIEQADGEVVTYTPFNGFTTVDFGYEKGNVLPSFVHKIDEADYTKQYLQMFDQYWADKDRMEDVTAQVLDRIAVAYRENAPRLLYYLTLHHVFANFLSEAGEDTLPNEATGFKDSEIWKRLFNFQRDAALGLIHKLEKYNGCILADSVGLGKTFTALAVIKYYEGRNKNVLVLCPKKLGDNWLTYKSNYDNNIIAADRLRYDVLFHTDLVRKRGMSNSIDLSRINWGNYDLVVIDESHNFRNSTSYKKEGGENRYHNLMEKVMKAGVKTKVLMLSATPVNNRFTDLLNQMQLAWEGDVSFLDDKLDTKTSVLDIFRKAASVYNDWSNLPPGERTTVALQKMLSFDFFKLLDAVTIARSRKHIETYYDTSELGKFPTRMAPDSRHLHMATLDSGLDLHYKDLADELLTLILAVYTPTLYIHESKRSKYNCVDPDSPGTRGLTDSGREAGMRRIMAMSLLKRLESSVRAFTSTVQVVLKKIDENLSKIEQFEKTRCSCIIEFDDEDVPEKFGFDADDEAAFIGGKKTRIDLADMDYVSWRRDMLHDKEVLDRLLFLLRPITPKIDDKLQTLLAVLQEKIESPFNPGNKKLLIFTAYTDTARYIYDFISPLILKKYGLHTGLVTGDEFRCDSIKGLKNQLNEVLCCFSPVSKERNTFRQSLPNEDIDILVATDCVSEGQNLQDCDAVLNFDIHWNPVRIIQRFGRVDRIGSKNEKIKLINFWPDVELDEYLQLKGRVESRMKAGILTAAGVGNPLSPDEQGDLDFRLSQMKRLEKEVVDVEEMASGVSVMDLGLNEYRLDLLEFMKSHPNLEELPPGLHAVVPATAAYEPGAIFVLRRVTQYGGSEAAGGSVENRLHPYYLVYVTKDGNCLYGYKQPKELLAALRLLCRPHADVLRKLCSDFNKRTDDGRQMDEYSRLLDKAVTSVIGEQKNDALSFLFSPGAVARVAESADRNEFELVCFIAIEGGAR